MSEYIFVLGRDKKLSLLEVCSYFNSRQIKYKIIKIFEDLLILELGDLDFKKILNNLGGVIKICKKCYLDNLYDGSKNKIFYSITVYGESDLYLDIKNYFKKEKIKIIKRQFTPSSKIDVDFLIYGNVLYKSIVVFNPKEYQLRDEVRPFFEGKSVISIRLAKILINLSGVKENELLLDVFCGLGTILQEASLMNVKSIGCDIDKEIVKKCRANLSKYKSVEVHYLDSRKVGSMFKKVDAIVTEPYMGPYNKKSVDVDVGKKTIKELVQLYTETLFSSVKCLKDSGRIVIIIPSLKTKGGILDIRMDLILQKVGLKLVQIDNCPVKMPYKYSSSGRALNRWIYILDKSGLVLSRNKSR